MLVFLLDTILKFYFSFSRHFCFAAHNLYRYQVVFTLSGLYYIIYSNSWAYIVIHRLENYN